MEQGWEKKGDTKIPFSVCVLKEAQKELDKQ